MKKRLIVLMSVLIVTATCLLVGCTSNMVFKDFNMSKENVVKVQVGLGQDTKETENSNKIEQILAELAKLDLPECKEKVEENIFNDSVVAKITIQLKDQQGKFVMTFAQTSFGGNETILLQCSAVDGFKMKDMPKGIYQMPSMEKANEMFIKLFYNII